MSRKRTQLSRSLGTSLVVSLGFLAAYSIYSVLNKTVHAYDRYLLWAAIGVFMYMVMVGIYLLATKRITWEAFIESIITLLGM